MNVRNLSGAYVAITALLAVSCASTTALAASSSAFDGSWNLEFATKAGSCDQAYNFNINISHGAISHPNLVRFTGNVAKSGAARASVRVGDKSASGSGRLTQTSGGGNWSGFSGPEKCSGTWDCAKSLSGSGS